MIDPHEPHDGHPTQITSTTTAGCRDVPNVRMAKARLALAAVAIGCAWLVCGSPALAGDQAPTTTTLPGVLCGDANGDGAVTAGDALLALRTAVGSSICSLEACDYTGDGQITASDALAILRKAVGQAVTPNCPSVPTTPLTWDEGTWGEVLWN